ncbi:hypothetical protein DFH06DRAFT_1483330 [Mycena polygramma]|nr:hypothetical protein DFH06DRAFT_1483330 [Mycena polygramma]
MPSNAAPIEPSITTATSDLPRHGGRYPETRTNSNPDDGSNAALTRAEGLWFEDCGLIIQAEKTLCRISRDYLASQSPVFKDMLALPSPKEADRMDGCPFVFLPDNAEDVTVFLKALMFYDFFEPYPAPTTLPILFGTLRMSYKYEVDPLKKRALTHISSLHPTTLRGYETLKTPWWFLCSLSDSWPAICHLARQLHIDWILPMAFFRVSMFAQTDTILSSSMELCDKIRCINAALVLEKQCVPALLDGCPSISTVVKPLTDAPGPGCYLAAWQMSGGRNKMCWMPGTAQTGAGCCLFARFVCAA